MTLFLARPLTEVPEALRRFNPSLPSPTELHITYRPSTPAMTEILDAARASQLAIADVRTEEVDLEDIFLQLTRSGPSQRAAS